MEDGEHSPRPPFFYSNHIYKMLENALDYGISENDFWEMTFAELDRLVASRQRMETYRAKEKATFDYILASLIGRAFAASMDNKTTYPEIQDVYPSLFDRTEKEIQKKELSNQLSALRFKQFANSYNKRFKEVASDNE
jgi:hypothetical protein